MVFLVLFLVVIGLTGFGIAYGGNDPPVMGHTFGEMDGGISNLGPVGSDGNDGMTVRGDPMTVDDTLFFIEDTTIDAIGLALKVVGDVHFDDGTVMVEERLRSYGDIVSSGNVYSGGNFMFDKRSSGGDCLSADEGAVYYDTDLNELCYCVGSTPWLQVDGGGNC